MDAKEAFPWVAGIITSIIVVVQFDIQTYGEIFRFEPFGMTLLYLICFNIIAGSLEREGYL